MFDGRKLFLVPPCDSEQDGELTVAGVRQARSLGDALGDVELKAVYAGPGLALEDTAAVIAQRHGLAVRKKPQLAMGTAPFDEEASRLLKLFENIARVGPGRTTVLVADQQTLGIIVCFCRGRVPTPETLIPVPVGSLTELDVEEKGYVIHRVGDMTHLGPLEKGRG